MNTYNSQEIRDIIESLTVGFCSINDQWIITVWNQAAEEITDFTRQEVINKNFIELFGEILPAQFIKTAAEAMENKTPATTEFYVPLRNKWAEVNIDPFRKGINLFFRDISSSRSLKQLGNLEKELLEIYTDESKPLTEIIKFLIDGIREIHPRMYCSVLKAVDQHLETWCSPHLPDEYNSSINGTPIGPEEGSCGAAAFFRKKIITSDIMHDERWRKYKHLAEPFRLAACVSQPFFDADKKLLGTFAIYLKEPGEPGESEMQTIEKTKGILETIIQKKLARESITRSQVNLREAQAIAHLGSWEMEYADGSSTWSDEMFHIFGVDVGAVPPTVESFFSFLHPEDSKRVIDVVQSPEIMQYKAPMNFRIIRRDGEIRYLYSEWRYEFNNQGKPSRIFGIVQDITDKTLAQAALKKSEEEYRRLFESSPLPLWVYDIETFRFLNVNCAAINHYGYSREEFLSMSIVDIRPAEDRPFLESVIKHIGEKRETNHHGRYRHVKKNGDIIEVDVQGNLIDFNGRPARLVQAIDVTQTLAHLRAIEKQNEQLREIAWFQSHVVRTPLTHIMSIIELLKNTTLTAEEQKTLFSYLNESAAELDNVIKSIVERTAAVVLK